MIIFKEELPAHSYAKLKNDQVRIYTLILTGIFSDFGLFFVCLFESLLEDFQLFLSSFPLKSIQVQTYNITQNVFLRSCILFIYYPMSCFWATGKLLKRRKTCFSSCSYHSANPVIILRKVLHWSHSRYNKIRILDLASLCTFRHSVWKMNKPDWYLQWCIAILRQFSIIHYSKIFWKYQLLDTHKVFNKELSKCILKHFKPCITEKETWKIKSLWLCSHGHDSIHLFLTFTVIPMKPINIADN